MKTRSQSVLFLALVLLPVLSIANEPGWCPACVKTTEVVLSAADAPVVNRWEPLQAPNPHRGDSMTPAVKTTEEVLQDVAEKLADCLLQVKEELSELRLVQEAMLTELARISESLDTIASHMTL